MPEGGNPRFITAAEVADNYAPIGGGGSFLSHGIVRVDPSGSDITGTVGDLSKPFLTVQGAVNAIALESFNWSIIDLGNNSYSEDVTSSTLGRLIFLGQSKESSGVQSITLFGQASYVVEFIDCNINDVTSDTSLEIHLQNSAINSTITSGGNVTVYGLGSGVLTATLSCPGHSINLHDIWSIDSYVIINSAGSAVSAFNTIISELNAADSCALTDSRIVANSAGVTPSYSDILFTKIVFPDADPHVIGSGYWVAGVLTKSAG